jgi:hypothetical protein
MVTSILLSIVLFAAGFIGMWLIIWLVWLSSVYVRLNEERRVVCPETHMRAKVRVDAIRGALAVARGRSGFKVRSCSLWPERQHCEQGCFASRKL